MIETEALIDMLHVFNNDPARERYGFGTWLQSANAPNSRNREHLVQEVQLFRDMYSRDFDPIHLAIKNLSYHQKQEVMAFIEGLNTNG